MMSAIHWEGSMTKMGTESPVPGASDAQSVSTKPTWTPEAIALLGSVPDREIAEQMGIPLWAVWGERTKRGISPSIARAQWDDKTLRLLGTMSDEALATELGISASRVTKKRNALGIPAFAPNTAFVIPPEYVDQLGKVSDATIAKALGVSQPTISARRRSLGISSQRTQGTFTAELDDLLGKDTDLNLAKRFGVTQEWIGMKRRAQGIPRFKIRKESRVVRPRYRWSATAIALLGTAPDLEVANQLGVTQRIVWYERVKHGIGAYRPKVDWSAETVALLGSMTDSRVALKLGISAGRVSAKRSELGIPRFKPDTGNQPQPEGVNGPTPD